MPQNAIEGALEAALEEHEIPVLWSHSLADLDRSGDLPVAIVEKRDKVSSGYASATTDWIVEKEHRVRADFVAGTDGNRSLVRRRLGIEWEEYHSPEYYAVFEFETDWEAKNEARVLLAPSGERHVFWPLPGGRCRASFLLSDPEAAVKEREKSRLTIQLGGVGYPHLRESTLLRLLDEQAPWFGGGVKEVKWSMIVRFEQRLAREFGAGRVWLAGDSAHLAGPIGVASMNIGFREGADLAGRAHEVIRGGLTSSRFEEYGRARQEEWKQILLPGGGFHAGSEANEFVREHAEILPSLLPASGEQLATLAGQLGLETGR
jgi:2-polyprenyl-6-methoxyphenol hydroxylase-like FAD-dependent oxidoreductase